MINECVELHSGPPHPPMDSLIDDAAQRYGIKVVISPRSSIAIAKMMRAGFTMREAFNYNFLASVDEPTAKKLLEDVDFD